MSADFTGLTVLGSGVSFIFNLIAQGVWDILACGSNLRYSDIIGYPTIIYVIDE